MTDSSRVKLKTLYPFLFSSTQRTIEMSSIHSLSLASTFPKYWDTMTLNTTSGQIVSEWADSVCPLSVSTSPLKSKIVWC